MSEFSIRPLYGGAIEVLFLSRLNSLGDLLPIPDTQEVFSDPQNKCSYIIELLEKNQFDSVDALKFIFSDIVDANQASFAEIISQEILNENVFRIEGNMTVNAEKVKVYLLVIRFIEFNTDLTFYVVDPEFLDPDGIRNILNTFQQSIKIKDRGLFC